MAELPVDSKDVALAALADLVRLMGAELVAGSHRDDIDLFEKAVRGKLGELAVSNCPSEVIQSGAARARVLVEAALMQVRAQRLSLLAREKRASHTQIVRSLH